MEWLPEFTLNFTERQHCGTNNAVRLLRVIPVLLTYNSDVVNAHQAVSDVFQAAFQAEVEAHHGTFCRKLLHPCAFICF